MLEPSPVLLPCVTGFIKLSKYDIKSAAKNCNISIGDLLYFVKPNKTLPYHATIIVKVTKSEIYYGAHTSPHQCRPLSEAINNDKVYIIRLLSTAS